MHREGSDQVVLARLRYTRRCRLSQRWFDQQRHHIVGCRQRSAQRRQYGVAWMTVAVDVEHEHACDSLALARGVTQQRGYELHAGRTGPSLVVDRGRHHVVWIDLDATG